MSKFKRLTSPKYNVKDSSSFKHNDETYMICTNIKEGGLIVLKEQLDGTYEEYDKNFVKWTWCWAPCTYKENGKMFVFFSDTGGAPDITDVFKAGQAARLYYCEYDVENKIWGNISKMIVGDDSFGLIDPTIKKIGDLYYLIYCNTKPRYFKEYRKYIPKCIQKIFRLYKEKAIGWDIYGASSTSLFGPYEVDKQLVRSGPGMYIEEAPCWATNDLLYWSENISDIGSYICSGIVSVAGKSISVKVLDDFRLEDTKSITTTHPDYFDGELKATLRDNEHTPFYIGKLIK